MGRELLHIYGPLSINSYGLFIVIGLFTFLWLAQRHPLRRAVVSEDFFVRIIVIGAFIGTIGGRLLYVLDAWPTFDHWWQAFELWQGGLSVLGTIIALVCTMPYYLRCYGIPILPFLDLTALHAPLLHAISRIGCFFAGCCYGIPTTVTWAITYTSTNTVAPLCIALHPTQLYSAAALLSIFVVLYYFLQRYMRIPGQLAASYLILAGIERFCLDFFRGDLTIYSMDGSLGALAATLSLQQWIACSIIGAGLTLFILVSFTSHKRYTY